MSFTFIECNKAVTLPRLSINLWGMVGYPRVYGHLPGDKEETYIYLSSSEEFQTMKRLMREADENNTNPEFEKCGWFHAYSLTLEPVPNKLWDGVTYNVKKVECVKRVCGAK
jgi:hypothetical protein